ncbi:hypothetical protein AB0B56_26375 [Streptosporangium canum]
MGIKGLRLHDLRHTGNALAVQSGASLAGLKARMGHDRAALIYQHATRDADHKTTAPAGAGGWSRCQLAARATVGRS